MKNFASILVLALASLCCICEATSYDTGVSEHYWSLDAPSYSVSNHSLQRTSIWGSLAGPYPTNAWWTNLALGEGRAVVNTLPYLVKLNHQGLYVCYPGRTITSTFIISYFIQNFGLTCTEPLESHEITSFDLMSVNFQFGSGDSKMKTTLIKGSPYMTLEYINTTPKVVTAHAILSVNGRSGPVTDSRFVIGLNNGQTWVIYASQNVTFNRGGSSLTATGKFTGKLRIALAQSNDVLSILDEHSKAIPVGCKVDYEVENDVAKIRYKWQKEGSGDLLMLALPHHMDVLSNPNTTLLRTYKTIKGYLTGIIGSTWTLLEPLTPLSWHSPRAPDASKLAAIKSALATDKNVLPRAADSYFFSKEIASMARVALIAEAVNEVNISDYVIGRLTGSINQWMTGRNWNPLKYDNTWKGVCTTQGMLYQAADFGQGWYNDHHYHYGYFTYAAAVIARRNPAWFQTYKSAILGLVRDFANPSARDTYFPVTRHMDWFDSHSWASGIVDFGDGKNQESTSEAVNAYYATYLFGLAINDTKMADLGRILLAMEIRGAQKYWQITNSSGLYEEPFASGKVVGMLWQLKVDEGTWFGGINVPFTHTIQMFPFTPITEQLLRKEWVKEAYPILRDSLPDYAVGDGWKGFVYMDHAIIDKEAAWEEVQSLKNFDDGNTKTNTLYWVATRP
jgi:endo-1,3(4)-beta-glucanase